MEATSAEQSFGPWRDLFQGGCSATVSTLATNPLLHWQFCRINQKTFRPADMWRGLLPNWSSYLGFLIVAHSTKGALTRGLDSWGWEHSDARELFIGATAGGTSSVGVCPGECVATKDNHLGVGTRKLLPQIVQEQGLRGLYRGFLPTLGRDIFSVGAVVVWGPMLEKKLVEHEVNPLIATPVASILTGAAIVAGTQPLQVTRVHMQVDPSLALRCVAKCLRGEYAQELESSKATTIGQRLRALGTVYYKGAMPRLAVNVVLVACSIFVEDKIDVLWNQLSNRD